MRKQIQIRASVQFVKNLDKLYPDMGSIRAKTEKLNKILEEIIYNGNKK